MFKLATIAKLEGSQNVTGRRPLKVLSQEELSNKNTKNEPVVDRNIFYRARTWLGAEMTLWLWTGGTKEVRTWSEMVE